MQFPSRICRGWCDSSPRSARFAILPDECGNAQEAAGAGHDRAVFHTNRWYRRHWPRDALPDPRFDGYDHRVAGLWADGQLAGYMYMLVLQVVHTVGPPWRRSLRHGRWLPELHFAFRPSPEELIGDYEFDSVYAAEDQTAEHIYQEVILTQTVMWEGKRYDLIWLEGDVETQAIIDRHFWEYDVDLSKPE